MYKLLGIGGFLLIMLYNFFGLKGPLIPLCIILVLILLIYINQNKILYIPRTPKAIQKFPTPLYHPRAIPLAGGILPSRAVTLRTCR